ncbi:MAG: bifunctional glutamate N-acetyltransferase/amino-acid acetyltransferase ArgJ [SAR202 cluster bacterium]|nr:bifunctional glutamate N-acetyltransferase/amino-acid acetyltransferase ArgJ [SAR202 cluster bacterium]
MASEITVIPNGSVTSPQGFTAGATYAGIRAYTPDKVDLGILFSEQPTTAAGTYSTNKILSPSVTVTKESVAGGVTRGVIVNSGCANCAVGDQGYTDAQEMASLAAGVLGVDPSTMAASSTGIIGVELPMGLIRNAIGNIEQSPDGGHDFARSILTTDTVTKEIAVSFSAGGKRVTLAGCAKGSGMIHPNMATMLSYLTTDAQVDAAFLQETLGVVVDSTFNMIDIDGDSSTNDTVLLLANGASGVTLSKGTPEGDTFTAALLEVCTHLAREMVRDGEGATKLIEVTVEGAESVSDARLAARSVASSILVKTAIHGNDPNWGRIIMALGKSGAEMVEKNIGLYINDICIMESGLPIPVFRESLIASMQGTEVRILAKLNIGSGAATGWGCNMSEEFVTFNSAYTT